MIVIKASGLAIESGTRVERREAREEDGRGTRKGTFDGKANNSKFSLGRVALTSKKAGQTSLGVDIGLDWPR